MKIILTAVLALIFTATPAQTNKNTLFQYASLANFMTPEDSIEYVVKKNFKISPKEFFKQLAVGGPHIDMAEVSSYPEIALLVVKGASEKLTI